MENPLRTRWLPSAVAENPLRGGTFSANPLLIPPMWVEAAVDEVAFWFPLDNVPHFQPLHGEVSTADEDVEMMDVILDDQVQELASGSMAGASPAVVPSPGCGQDEDAPECPICMRDDVSLVTTSCNHIFCRGCISQVLSGPAHGRKCPMCRHEGFSLRGGL